MGTLAAPGAYPFRSGVSPILRAVAHSDFSLYGLEGFVMPGPTPKHPGVRQRQNRVSTASSLVDTNPLENGIPELPKRKDEKGRFASWRPEVKAWWEDVWTSPMASEYVQADIHGLVMLADLMDRYWRNPTAALATEIRLQRQCFGLTPIDRRRLQWEVKRAESGPQPSASKSQPVRNDGETPDPRGALRAVK